MHGRAVVYPSSSRSQTTPPLLDLRGARLTVYPPPPSPPYPPPPPTGWFREAARSFVAAAFPCRDVLDNDHSRRTPTPKAQATMAFVSAILGGVNAAG